MIRQVLRLLASVASRSPALAELLLEWVCPELAARASGAADGGPIIRETLGSNAVSPAALAAELLPDPLGGPPWLRGGGQAGAGACVVPTAAAAAAAGADTLLPGGGGRCSACLTRSWTTSMRSRCC